MWRVWVPLSCNVSFRYLVYGCLVLLLAHICSLYFQGELPLRWMAIESIFKGITTTKSDV